MASILLDGQNRAITYNGDLVLVDAEPLGTKSITTNGTKSVVGYANVNVQVPTTAPDYYVKKITNAVYSNNRLCTDPNFTVNLDGITQIGDGGLAMEYGLFGWRAIYADVYPDIVQSITRIPDFSHITWVGCYGLFKTFYFCKDMEGEVDFSSLTHTSPGNQGMAFQNAFCYCKKITRADFSSYDPASQNGNIGDSTFYQTFLGCSSLVSIDFRSLELIDFGANSFQEICKNCTSLTSFNFESLTAINDYGSFSSGFEGCTSLTTARFPSLRKVIRNSYFSNLFKNCTSLQTVYFNSLKEMGTNTSQFYRMLYGCSNVTVHFPSSLQSVISSWSDVINGFGGTNTTVLFDLPATNLLTGANTTVYERNPKYDTATALAWRVQDTGTTTKPIIDWTPFYTSGLTDPTVGTTIYSDSTCTTTVTTVSSIS